MSDKPSSPSRGRRPLTDEEKALWEGVARSLKPLRRKAKTSAKKKEEMPGAATGAAPIAKSKPKSADKPVVKNRQTTPAPAKIIARPAPPKLAPFTRKTRSRVARGMDPIHTRIDLHGMTQDEAHAALRGFILRASNEGASLVLVITGKGRIADENRERGVLRRRVPQWLAEAEFRRLIVGFEEAHIGHGGEGALYVRLRKKKPGN